MNLLDGKNWESAFRKIARIKPDFLLDADKLNATLFNRSNNPYRWRVASFCIPKDATPEQRKQIGEQRIYTWIEMEGKSKSRWALASKVEVYGPFRAFDLATMFPLFDMDEWRARAVFVTVPVPLRLTVPAGIVRQSPDQEASLEQIIKAGRGQ